MLLPNLKVSTLKIQQKDKCKQIWLFFCQPVSGEAVGGCVKKKKNVIFEAKYEKKWLKSHVKCSLCQTEGFNHLCDAFHYSSHVILNFNHAASIMTNPLNQFRVKTERSYKVLESEIFVPGTDQMISTWCCPVWQGTHTYWSTDTQMEKWALCTKTNRHTFLGPQTQLGDISCRPNVQIPDERSLI